MNTSADETVKFIENHISDTDDSKALDEIIATLAMDTAECWF